MCVRMRQNINFEFPRCNLHLNPVITCRTIGRWLCICSVFCIFFFSLHSFVLDVRYNSIRFHFHLSVSFNCLICLICLICLFIPLYHFRCMLLQQLHLRRNRFNIHNIFMYQNKLHLNKQNKKYFETN